MVEAKNSHEPEFLQAVKEVLDSLRPAIEQNPQYEQAGILERLVEPDRQILFRQGACQSRHARAVQQLRRPLQGWPASAPVGQPQHHQIPRL